MTDLLRFQLEDELVWASVLRLPSQTHSISGAQIPPTNEKWSIMKTSSGTQRSIGSIWHKSKLFARWQQWCCQYSINTTVETIGFRLTGQLPLATKQ